MAFSGVFGALKALFSDTVLDGEVVTLDSNGRPFFTGLQNFPKSNGAICFDVFDLPILAGADLHVVNPLNFLPAEIAAN